MTHQAELTQVIYNASEQAFEAVVTFQSGRGALRYAAQFHAPMTMDFEAASDGLIENAYRMHKQDRGMRAAPARKVVLPMRRAMQPTRPTHGRWLDTLLSHARAA